MFNFSFFFFYIKTDIRGINYVLRNETILLWDIFNQKRHYVTA